MKINRIDIERSSIPLIRPYTVAYETRSDVDLLFARVETDTGLIGYGSGSPAAAVTGESFEAAFKALTDGRLTELIGSDPRAIGSVIHQVRRCFSRLPAAMATVEIALWDLFGKATSTPVVDIIGRCHRRLPTSITLGIQSVERTLADAEEYLGRGFHVLKVKIGHEFERDIECISRLRELGGDKVELRVDANQGYSFDETRALFDQVEALGVSVVEQPMAPSDDERLALLDPQSCRLLVMDESVQTPGDAWRLARSTPGLGAFNIKLMKTGGITRAGEIAKIAHLAGLDLMWGCMDESVISISAALHAAFSSPATRYLDLDGSFDLARDPARGGFDLTDGYLSLRDAPGLGIDMDWPGNR
ncbi:MAG: dipeptide epimerase [Myxococcota bacterium]